MRRTAYTCCLLLKSLCVSTCLFLVRTQEITLNKKTLRAKSFSSCPPNRQITPTLSLKCINEWDACMATVNSVYVLITACSMSSQISRFILKLDLIALI